MSIFNVTLDDIKAQYFHLCGEPLMYVVRPDAPEMAWVYVPKGDWDERGAVEAKAVAGREVLCETDWLDAVSEGRDIWVKLVVMEPNP